MTQLRRRDGSTSPTPAGSWGLTADQRPTTHPVAGNGAVDALAALQDFDGISYARGSNVLRQLAVRLGDDIFFGGVRDLFERHRFGNATMHDLFDCWSRAGAGDLDGFIKGWLLTAGPDVLTLDREAGVVRRTPPDAFPADRRHRLVVATHGSEGWQRTPLEVDGPETPLTLADPRCAGAARRRRVDLGGDPARPGRRWPRCRG